MRQHPNVNLQTPSRIEAFNNTVHRAQVIALWQSVFGYDSPHNKAELAIDKKLQFNDGLLFVALIEREVVGTVMAGYDGHRGWIYSVAVAPAFRKRGIGTQLLKRAEQALIGKGAVKINLQIMDGNEAVAAFYTSLGYSVEKRVSMGKRIPANIPS